jgi:hypothetical protein
LLSGVSCTSRILSNLLYRIVCTSTRRRAREMTGWLVSARGVLYILSFRASDAQETLVMVHRTTVIRVTKCVCSRPSEPPGFFVAGYYWCYQPKCFSRLVAANGRRGVIAVRLEGSPTISLLYQPEAVLREALMIEMRSLLALRTYACTCTCTFSCAAV